METDRFLPSTRKSQMRQVSVLVKLAFPSVASWMPSKAVISALDNSSHGSLRASRGEDAAAGGVLVSGASAVLDASFPPHETNTRARR